LNRRLRGIKSDLYCPSPLEYDEVTVEIDVLDAQLQALHFAHVCTDPEDVNPFGADLLDRQVEVIVNAWNRNIIPWWLLMPQGVSGAVKRRGGYKPFQEVGRFGAIPLGGAVLTSAGRLSYKGIIHVAGINMLWRASAMSIQGSVRSAMALVAKHEFRSLAFPVIGAGSGGFKEPAALELMLRALKDIHSTAQVVIVRYRRNGG
jgi:O-acetyl-ADP-ribose deacetylase (regulator of RNase III)